MNMNDLGILITKDGDSLEVLFTWGCGSPIVRIRHG